jgi:hypothetical protein
VPDYTPQSKLAEVIERVAFVIESATPTIAPSVPFQRHTDTTCKLEHLTDPEGRVRRFEIRSESPSYGMLAWGVNIASLARVLRIRIGYPACDFYPEADDELVDGHRYLTEDLKSDDAKLLIRLLEGNACFAAQDDDHPAIENVQLPLLRGEIDEASGKVRALLYGVEYQETYQ